MGDNYDKLNANLKRLEELSARMVAALAQRPKADVGLQGPGPDIYLKAGMAYWAEAMTNPAKLMERQVEFWGESLRNYAQAQAQMAQGLTASDDEALPNDRRFANPLWKTHPYFRLVRQQYAAASRTIEEAVADLEGLDDKDRARVDFLARQMIDMMAPTNFLATNPDALERAVATEGESLVKGMENLVRDIEARHGEFLPTLADPDAFEVGRNIGTAEGAVVFRNEMIELIQFAPTTESVHKTPLIIFPPWINKYYVLDLRPENSLIRWIVDQGFTLFVVSWRNPGPAQAGWGLEDYITQGYLTAIETARAITGAKKVNVVGYCIAGTTLSLTLAYLKKLRKSPVKSATFFTTLTDFSDQGEFTVFLQDDFVDAIERQCAATGILDSFFMSKTFSYLRASDLVYGPAVRSYMMGEAPPAFDLLYWNGDGTNLPQKMLVEYLRGLCQNNALATTGFKLFGKTLRIRDVDLPVCAIACETDHIAAWDDSYRGIRQMGAQDKTFILSQSGHIAGIVNPPSKNKYGHYTHSDFTLSAPEWRQAATFHAGSWWPRWGEWLAAQSGSQVPARLPGDSGFPALAPAPGTYVSLDPEV